MSKVPSQDAIPLQDSHNSPSNLSQGGFAPFPPLRFFRADAAWPRLGRPLRTAPVSRQTNPNRTLALTALSLAPCHPSPRLRSLLFPGVALFFLAAALVKEKTSRHRQKRKKS
jgi:hypothetical protein